MAMLLPDILPIRPKTLSASSSSENFDSDNVSCGDSTGDDDVIIVGIDFGTTFSGVAWATMADFESGNINLITNWPGSGLEEGKAPTELFYEDGQIMWGYEIPPDGDPIRWFKLLLLKEDDLSPELRSSEFLLRGRKMLKENRKTAVDLIADYLRLLWKHVIETIIKSRGRSVIDALRFHVVITVPAIWKGYARQGMMDATRRSGILDSRLAGDTSLTFAPEPEAAAMSTLCEPGRMPKKGEVYMVCDAGGGTVDVISYKIDQTDPVSMHEAVEGTGGLCGGIFVDEAFEHMCKSRLGRKWDRLSKAGIKDLMKREWEHTIKPQFMPSSNGKEYIVGIPAEAFIDSSLDDLSRQPVIKSGRIHFRSSDIQKSFIKSFSDILKLLNAQIDTARAKGLFITGIILVGGLGGSPYLYQYLEARYAKLNIRILQASGMRPRTAICRGAVLKGLLDYSSNQVEVASSTIVSKIPIHITSTISRSSFGMDYRERWNERKHLQEDKEWDNIELKWTADNQMHWYLKRGENVSKKTPVRLSYYINFLKGEFKRSQSFIVMQCDDIIPPTRKTSSVKFLCKINCKLDISLSELKSYTNRYGRKYRKLVFEVEMIPSGASVEFIVYVNGQIQGGKNVDVHF